MANSERYSKAFSETLYIFTFLGPAILLWAGVSFLFHRQLIFGFSGAIPVTRKEYPEIYNIVENLCISRGLPTPNIGILEDSSLNAFAVGWNPKKSWIVFSRGILDKLSKEEIEAVAAHELTHILNKDGLLLVTIIVYIGAIAAIGELLVRGTHSSSNKKNSGGILLLLGLVLLILGYLILPLVQLAVSRKREYLADAGSVQLTQNRDSMIRALEKISTDSTIESIKKDSLSALCISNPFPTKLGILSRVHSYFSTHPSTPDRIEMLRKY
jgi:heat shock protein HtpX